jgi:non-specific serine/threonine protein kinase/serine/threonine-protein kinase
MEDVVLAGRYRLHSLLGAGGMAEVYDGRDERLARPVAVKLLRPDLAAIADLRRRFELEARAAARLTHPNVVAVYDAGEDNGRSYIVMERLRGESLADTIERGPVDLAWLHRLAGDVLGALGAAHEAGIVHRDIKPANILLGADGRAKVADFGIARVIELPAAAEAAHTDTAAALTGTGLVVGTPAYLAPERAMGEPATPQSDLYSLGVVLYEALTGTKPFPGKTPVAIAAAAVQGSAQDPLLLRPDADRQFVSVIARAMALDPAQRYATAAEMAADLRRPAPPVTAIMPAGSPLGARSAPPRPSPPLPPPVLPPRVGSASPTRPLAGSPASPGGDGCCRRWRPPRCWRSCWALSSPILVRASLRAAPPQPPPRPRPQRQLLAIPRLRRPPPRRQSARHRRTPWQSRSRRLPPEWPSRKVRPPANWPRD